MLLISTREIRNLKWTSKNEVQLKAFLWSIYKGSKMLTVTTRYGVLIERIALKDLFNENKKPL